MLCFNKIQKNCPGRIKCHYNFAGKQKAIKNVPVFMRKKNEKDPKTGEKKCKFLKSGNF